MTESPNDRFWERMSEAELVAHSIEASARIQRNLDAQMLRMYQEPEVNPVALLAAVREWREARLALCAAKINTPECMAAFTRLGQAEDALSTLAGPRKQQEARQ